MATDVVAHRTGASVTGAVPDLLARAAEEHGDRPWLTVIDQPPGPLSSTWTFAGYERATRAAGQVWRELGVERGDRVVVALANRVEFLLAWHGLASIGAVMVPLNLHYLAREAGHVISHSGAGTVLTTRDHADEVVRPCTATIDRPPTVVLVDDFADRVVAASPRVDDVDLAGDDAAAVLYTSGTTGAPKGCVTTHDHFTLHGRLLADRLHLDTTSTKLVMLPLFHMNAENSTMATLAAGARMVLRDGFSASAFWPSVHEHQITHTHYLGPILPILDARRDPGEVASPLRVLWGAGCSGDALSRLEERWQVRLIEVFGMTETGMDLCNPWDERRPGSCGVPVPGRDVRLVDETGEEVPVGAVGEITIRRIAGMTTGYLDDDAATARLYVDGWLHSGDLAHRDADGFHYFVDRAKDVIRRSGENISSAEVEAVLREHEDVVDAACVPMPDPYRDEEVHVVVVLREGRARDDVPPAALAAFCAERLAPYKVPRYIEYRDDLPRTPTGKVQKQQLRGGGDDVLDGSHGWQDRRLPDGGARS